MGEHRHQVILKMPAEARDHTYRLAELNAAEVGHWQEMYQRKNWRRMQTEAPAVFAKRLWRDDAENLLFQGRFIVVLEVPFTLDA